MSELKKYRVTGWLKVTIDIEKYVDAINEEEAKEFILEMAAKNELIDEYDLDAEVIA